MAPTFRCKTDTLICPNFTTHIFVDYNKRHESELVDRCKGMHGMLNYNLLAYTVQPIPFLGRVDLAAVFLHRRKFAAENLLFGTSFPIIVHFWLFICGP